MGRVGTYLLVESKENQREDGKFPVGRKLVELEEITHPPSSMQLEEEVRAYSTQVLSLAQTAHR